MARTIVTRHARPDLTAVSLVCSNHPPASVVAIAGSHNAMAVAALFQDVANYNDQNFGASPKCSVIFGLQWWLTSVFFFTIIGILACTHNPSILESTGMAWAVLLGVITALLWPFCQRYDTINWNLHNVHTLPWSVFNSGTLKARIECTFARYILESFAAVMLIFGVNSAMAKLPVAAAATASPARWASAVDQPHDPTGTITV